MSRFFSWSRWFGIVGKEFIQMKRDRLTFAMIIGIPVMQLVLFGFAINSDPKHLPAAVRDADRSEFSRSILAALKNSDYFDFRPRSARRCRDRPAARDRRRAFVVTIPGGLFARARPRRAARAPDRGRRDRSRGDRQRDRGGQPARAGRAHARSHRTARAARGARPRAFEVRVHPRYNPEAITQYNIVPGLMGVILTMTMVLMTGLAITRETERGTMENLLATPASPLEVMTGKIVPYVLIGLIQVTLILILARLVFDVPMPGQARRSLCRRAPVHRGEPDARPHVLVARAEPAAGDADDVLLLPAVDPAVRLHVSVSRDARLGAGDRRGAAAHAFPADRARRAAQGQRPVRSRPRALADRAVHADRRRDRLARRSAGRSTERGGRATASQGPKGASPSEGGGRWSVVREERSVEEPATEPSAIIAAI